MGYAAAGYTGNKLAGVQNTAFSWKSIAASAISSVATAGIGHAIGLKSPNAFGGSGSFTDDFAQGMIGGVVNLHVRRAFGFDDKVDYGNIAANAFGNALGNKAVSKLTEVQQKSIAKKVILSQVGSMRAEIREDATARGIDLDDMSHEEKMSYIKPWIRAQGQRETVKEVEASVGAFDCHLRREVGIFGLADLMPQDEILQKMGEGWKMNSWQLNPVARGQVSFGMLVGVIGSAWEDGKSLASLAVAANEAGNDLLTIIGNQSPGGEIIAKGFDRLTGSHVGTAIQKKLYGDALSRTIDRVRTLQYMYDNMGTLIKQGVTNEFDELKQSYANAETFMRQRDYLSSGIAMGELAYKVVPLVLGLAGAARAGAVTIARIAEKGLWSSMTEAATAMKSVVRSPSTATKTVIGRVLTRAERLAAFIDDADGLRKRFGLGAALDRNGGNISIAEVDVPAFGESTTMRAFNNNPQLSNAAKKKFLSDSVSEDEKIGF